MKLRDEASSLDELCKTYQKDQVELEAQLLAIGYKYESNTNQFVAE